MQTKKKTLNNASKKFIKKLSSDYGNTIKKLAKE